MGKYKDYNGNEQQQRRMKLLFFNLFICALMFESSNFLAFVSADSTIIEDGTLMWNMAEISPHGKVKAINVSNWGKKYNEPRVWCCVPCLFEFDRLAVIQETWGTYCDKLFFFIGDNAQKEVEVLNVTQKLENGMDYTLYNVVKLKLKKTGYGELYEKVWKMRQFVHVYHENDYDWMIKADTDTWFSTPNFKGFAQYFDPNLDWYFGEVLTYSYWAEFNIAYAQGGAYALSRGAIKKLNRVYLTDEFLNPLIDAQCEWNCRDQSAWIEDAYTGICLKSIGIFPTNSLDTQSRTRWSAFTKQNIESNNVFVGWYQKYGMHRFKHGATGKGCCAEHMISFHAYKNKDLSSLFNDYSNLDGMYNEPSKDNWINHQIPPKPITFLFDDSFANNIDEYFNIENPPKGQRIWKGEDNLWNYKDDESRMKPSTKQIKVTISISALIGLFVIMFIFGCCQARFAGVATH